MNGEHLELRVSSAPGWLREVPLAHRGLHGPGVPENSLASFAAARDAGVGIELDVRLSADGVPVVFHDRTVTRDGATVHVSRMTAEELSLVRLGDTDEHVPTLAQALEVAGQAPVMVEIKNERARAGGLEAAAVTVMAAHDDAGGGPTCAASFNPWTLRWLRRRRPAVDRVLTAGPMDNATIPAGMKWTVRTLRLLARIEPVAVSYDVVGLDAPSVQEYREAGGTVVAWTVSTPELLATARRLADNVIFERLSVEQVLSSAATEAGD